MIFRVKSIALAALFCVLTTGLRAWADTDRTNPVTGETETYANVFTGGTEQWNSADNWDTSTTPFIATTYSPALVAGKTVSTTTAIEGWTLRVGAYNGATITWSGGISKIQAGTIGCWLTADETSSITISSFGGNQLEGSASNPFKISSANAGGITWSTGLTSASNTSLPFWYYFKGNGTVVYGGDITVANAQVIKQADITLSGTSQIASKTLVTFGSGSTVTFVADATIKRLDSVGTDLASDAHLSVVNTSGATTLTTASGVGKSELVQTSSGIVLYWVDGDPSALAPETYTPSISINFTSGTSLSTSSDVGIGDYAIPGTSWNNLIGNNGSLATVTGVDTNGISSTLYGAKVTISGTRGYWTKSGLDAASDLRQGYIDDNAGNATPTVAVTGIPYNSYKVVIICSSDSNTTKFGYMTVNGTHYKGGSGTTEICSGADSDIWGSASDSTFIEGQNFLVTPEIKNTDGKLTIVSHRLTGSRAGIAAIQVVEVAPAITENDLVIDVAGETDYPVDEAKEVSGTVYIRGNGTLTLSGSSKITAASIDVGPLVTLNANASRLDATAYTGSGTVVYSNALPPSGKGWTDSAWTGTVWINGKSGLTNFNVNPYGNGNSSVKLSGVDGWVSAPGNYTYTNAVPIILENGSFDYALKLTNGNSPNVDNPVRCTAFVKVSGSGTISDGTAANPMIKIFDASGYTGAITLTRARVVFCLPDSTTLPAAYNTGIATASIYVDAGMSVTVPSDKVWSATNGITVGGELRATGIDRFGASTTITTTDNGVFTLTSTGNGNVSEYNTSYARIAGTGSLKYEGFGWRALSQNNLSKDLTIINEQAGGILLHTTGTYNIGSLAGSKNFLGNYGSDSRYLNILQTKDTEWSGKVADDVYSRLAGIIITNSSTGTLTLSGTATQSVPLNVDGGAVNLTGTWVGNTTVSGTFGGTGTLTGDLTFKAGSTLRKLAHNNDGLSVSGTLTYPSDGSKIMVDVSSLDLTDEYGVTLLSLSGLSSVDVSRFDLIDTSIPFHLVADGGKLVLVRESDYPNLFNDSVTFTLNNIGTTPIENYTLLVRISKNILPGFTYDRAGADGSEIAFTDGYGEPLSHEIDTWNIHGESLVWVKVPYAQNGTRVIFYWSLKAGQLAPPNVPTAVWTDYAGVWHMDDAVDSSGNSAEGTLHAKSVKRNDGKFGGAYGRTETGVKGPIATIPKSDVMDALTDGAFTVSAWVRLNSTSGLNYPYFFSRKDVNATAGWGVQLDGNSSSSSTKLWANGSNSISFSPAYKANDWVYMSVVLANGSATMLVDGVQYGPTANGSFVPATDTSLDFYIGGARADDTDTEGGRTNTLNGDMDEVRLYKGATSIERVKAEYANTMQTNFRGAVEGDGVSFLVPSTVVSDGKEYDYWLGWPTISPKYWSDDAPPAAAELIYSNAVLRSGAAVTNWCENRLTHDIIYDVSPENIRNLPIGSYRIYCARSDMEDVIMEEDQDRRYVDFTIVKNSGTPSVGDTASGRILLMNNDFSQGGDAENPSIGCQGYSNTNAEDSVYWEFIGDKLAPKLKLMNIMDGTNSILWAVSEDKTVTNKLWHIMACRHGNTFPKSGLLPLGTDQNYLPYSGDSCCITNGSATVGSRADAGQLLMQNTLDAAVYSPCYEEGIGTIYFDAVNGWNDNLGSYRLAVEYATNTTTGVFAYDLPDEDSWHACTGYVARVTGGDTLLDPEPFTGEFDLAVDSDRPTTTGEFYRVYAKLDIREPARFRIRRTGVDTTRIVDGNAYLLLDNIIASYPAMDAKLDNPGWYDPEKKGLGVLGFEGAFTKPFPVAGDDAIQGKASVEYYVNSLTDLAETNFFASAKMHYRWRYLSQKVSEWKSVELNPTNDILSLSVDCLDLPGEMGDVEFWYEYVLQAPYYSYVDYTGLPGLQSAFAAKYTEAKLGPQTNRADVVLNDYPTGGTDWFVRLRRNSSDYDAVRLHFKTNDSDSASAVDMSLVGNGTWRGFVPTQIALDDGLFYRIEGLNPQTGGEWQWSTNYLSAISTGVEPEPVVASIYMSGATDTNNWNWARVACDAATGYLMFQFDERTLSLTITHADYQNINKWHDAHDADGSFVGSSIEDEDAKKSGTSSKTRDFSEDYDAWADTPLTMAGLWEEAFEFPGVETATSFGGKSMYEPFDSADTLNQWKIGPGMWVYSRHYNPDYADHWALQMKGNGAGYMMFTGGDEETPYGIGSVSFKARLAQPISLDTMSYDDAASRGLTNYTFFSYASLRDNGSTDNFDGDASVSVLAYYTPQKGCYEFRVTQNDSSSLMLSIYRWTKPGAPTGKATLLAQQKFSGVPDNIMKMYGADAGASYGGLFISCSNAVDRTGIVAGILRYPHGSNPNDTSEHSGVLRAGTVQLGACTWIGLVCEDSDASRLTAGRYGVTSKNCPALFWNPRHCEREVSLPFTPGGNVSAGEATKKKYYDYSASGGENKFQIDGVMPPQADAVNSLQNNSWAIDESRFVVTNMGSTANWGLAARTIPQKVAVEWAPAGKSTGFTGIATNVVESYVMETYHVPVYLKNDASLRLQMVGGDEDARADVAIDNVSFTQFRGGTMGGRDADYVTDDNYGYRTNFYFSSCWMTNGMAKMSARRTLSDGICAIRSPLMDGIDGRGIGLGMFSFEYKNAQTNTTLILQIATNITELSVTKYNDPKQTTLWQDVTNFTFTADTEDLAHGTRSCYLGLHGVTGMMRLIVDPAKEAEVASYTDPTAFGEIDIESVLCRDEPVLDERSWWGWNIRTLNSDETSAYDDGSRTILHDYGTGLSLAINNSVSEDTKRINGDLDPSFKSYMPFVQTPTFTSNIVGEVSFVARRFDNEDEEQFAEVALYGAKDGNASDWGDPLCRFIVSNTVYETYTYQIQGESGYSAFRLAVTGVDGVDDPARRGPDPECGDKPVRVMIDEIAVFEAVKPTMGFRYVYPFRTKLDETGKHEGVVDGDYNPQPDEQPLSGESWTVQAEIQAKQLPDQIDFSKTPKVLFHWFVGGGVANWGWEQWRDRKSGSAELALADGETMVFRGSVPLAPSAIVDPNDSAPVVVQYIAQVVYATTSGEVLTNILQKSEWNIPQWYSPVDYNVRFAGRGWSPFTILDTLSPKRAWINEVNVFDGKVGTDYPGYTNQYVEVAVPQRQPIDGWSLQYIDYNMTTNTLCTFGSDGIAATKTLNETNGYVFVTVQSPYTDNNGNLSSIAGEVDGTWADFDGNGGKLDQTHAMALKLVRKSGVVEQEIVLVGTNRWVGTAREEVYSHDTFINKLKADGHTGVYYVGDEFSSSLDTSLGVTNGTGEVKACWTSPMKQTPGRANVDQAVPENYVILANGTMLRVFSKIGELGKGHVRQTFGALVDSTEDTYVMTFKGEGGTNIVYTIDQWWEIASLTTNDIEVAGASGSTSSYTLAAGAYQSNDVTVVVSAQPRKDLREDHGLTEDNKYTSAVLDWLANGETLNGPFANPGKLEDSYFGSVYDLDSTIRPLTLTERYWLDIDPTTNWVFRAGIVKAPSPVAAYAAVDPDKVPAYDTVDNLRITVKMFVTNETGAVYAPYVLRGFEPGSVSTNYSFASDYTWTSVTFKVTGDLQNGLPMRKRWVPLRRFIFAPGSFDSNYEAEIEVWDPFDDGSIWTPGWSDFKGYPVFYSWSIDDRGGPDTVEALKPDSTFKTSTP